MDAVDNKIHIRYNGSSHDFSQDALDIGVLSDDATIKNAVANQLGINVASLANYEIDRNQLTGDITIRPDSGFGY